MNDPHVSKLFYRVETGDTVDYDEAEPLEHECTGFTLHIAEGRLTVTMEDHYASAQDARNAVDPFLRAWEIDAALQRGLGDLSFKYENHELIDRSPESADGTRVVQLQAAVASALALSATVTARVSCSRYPTPPSDFAVSPDVETLWDRYRGYLEGREPLPSMAYFCLTKLEDLAGSRGQAAHFFAISTAVLNRLAQLKTERGDPKIARKAGAHPPFSPGEVTWLETAIKSIIRQLGIIESGTTPRQLTMADLPRLP